MSGSRPDALKRARVEHINFKSRILHIPKPKGGEEKAFDIPLSRTMINCLVRVMRVGRVLYPTQAREWLFPADSARGHIVEHKEEGATLAKWDNDLRQTYRTIAQTVGIGDLDIHLLMNHAAAGVNAGYITRSKLLSDHLRQQQEMISRKMIDVVRGRVKREEQRAMTWPLLPARTLLKNVLRLVEDGSPEKQALTVGATRRPQRPTAARGRDAPKLGPVPKTLLSLRKIPSGTKANRWHRCSSPGFP